MQAASQQAVEIHLYLYILKSRHKWHATSHSNVQLGIIHLASVVNLDLVWHFLVLFQGDLIIWFLAEKIIGPDEFNILNAL